MPAILLQIEEVMGEINATVEALKLKYILNLNSSQFNLNLN